MKVVVVMIVIVVTVVTVVTVVPAILKSFKKRLSSTGQPLLFYSTTTGFESFCASSSRYDLNPSSLFQRSWSRPQTAAK